MGGDVDFLMLDGALRRTILNGMHKQPHAAFMTIGTVGSPSALTFRVGRRVRQETRSRVAYTVPGPDTARAVTVSGTDITIQLATDAAGRPTSTAASVKLAVELSAGAPPLWLTSAIRRAATAPASLPGDLRRR